MNLVILSGRLTRDPDVRYSQGAEPMAIARFSLAVDKNYKKQNDEAKANFINCVAFGKTAEVVEKYCLKGTKLFVTGEWTTGSYKNKDGNTVYTNDCNIQKLEFAESKGGNGGSQDAPVPMPGNASANGFMDIPPSVLAGTDLPFK